MYTFPYTKEDCNSGHTCQLNSPDTDHVNDEPVGLEAAKHQGVEVRKIGRLELAAENKVTMYVCTSPLDSATLI